MKVLFIVPRLDKASTRYRVLQYQPYFEKMKINTKVKTLPGKLIDRLKLWRSCKEHDVVFLQKRLLSAWDLYWLRKFSTYLCYDFDDAVMLTDSASNKNESSNRKRKFSRIVKNSDLVIAGNSYLSEIAHKYGASNIKVVNTPVELKRYHVKEHLRESDSVTIGWIGSNTTLGYLEIIRPALEAIGKKHPQIKLKLISDRFLNFDHIETDFTRWDYESEIDELNSFDIGIMPLTDDRWSRGKCGFKLLQYMAVGIPTVCHPIGLNKEIVLDGETGLWATTHEQWVDALSRLIVQEELRKEMGKKGRERVSKLYSTEINAKRLADNLHEITNSNIQYL